MPGKKCNIKVKVSDLWHQKFIQKIKYAFVKLFVYKSMEYSIKFTFRMNILFQVFSYKCNLLSINTTLYLFFEFSFWLPYGDSMRKNLVSIIS